MTNSVCVFAFNLLVEEQACLLGYKGKGAIVSRLVIVFAALQAVIIVKEM